MNAFTRVMIGLVVATGAAGAQPKPERSAPPELIELTKILTGAWKCKGEMSDGTALAPVTATSKWKADLDKFWLVETLELKGTGSRKVTTYTTFDPPAKKWRRVSLDNYGGQMVGTADASSPTVQTFNLDIIGGGQFRDHSDVTDPKTLHEWGEISKDKGKSWSKYYDLTCKR